MGMTWLAIGLTLAFGWYAYAMGRSAGAFHVAPDVMRLVYPIWESFLCCGVCIGFLVLFREKLDVQSRWSRWMAENQYAAYLFHVPVIVLIQAGVVYWAMSPFAKFALVTAAGVPLTWLLSAAVRTPVLVRRVL
jgi:peptidoglycan/LPS O-acetylase OafA/YrhL